MTPSNGNIFRVAVPLWGGAPVTGWLQWPVTRSFDVFFDLHLNKYLNNEWRRQWFETLSRSLWRQCNDFDQTEIYSSCLY